MVTLMGREMMPAICVGVNEGSLHFDHSHEFVCKHVTCSYSKAMGQVLLPLIEGGPFYIKLM